MLDVGETLLCNAHSRDIKAWHDDATQEHYEAQLVRIDGGTMLEVGFRVEHPKVALNEAELRRLLADESDWRKHLGDKPEAGVFIGADRWRRISEIWNAPDPDDIDTTIETAARLADYVSVFEPRRRT